MKVWQGVQLGSRNSWLYCPLALLAKIRYREKSASMSCCAVTVNQEAQAAKEMLLMATSADEQKMWVQRLSKKVSRKGISQPPVTSGAGGDRPATGYVHYLLSTLDDRSMLRSSFHVTSH